MKIKDPALFGKINVFFTEYLPVVRRESPNTIKAYLYTINIYFDFLEDMRRIKLWEVSLADFTWLAYYSLCANKTNIHKLFTNFFSGPCHSPLLRHLGWDVLFDGIF